MWTAVAVQWDIYVQCGSHICSRAYDNGELQLQIIYMVIVFTSYLMCSINIATVPLYMH